MSNVDQFESVFKAAHRSPYQPVERPLGRVMVLTDLDAPGAEEFGERVRAFLAPLIANGDDDPVVTWRDVPGDASATVDDVLALLESESPDLVCTYRSLHTEAWRWSYTLGRYVEILAHETPVPVLLFPNPTAETKAPEVFVHGPPRYSESTPNTIMAMTDHLAGDHELIHWAARFAPEDGKLILTHVEDDRVFARYMDAISKIPDLDTDTARTTIRERLLKEPADYIESVRKALAEAGRSVEVESVITLGHRLREHAALVQGHDVDLLVLHTKDDDQLAMHGVAYPLVVELRHIPILML